MAGGRASLQRFLSGLVKCRLTRRLVKGKGGQPDSRSPHLVNNEGRISTLRYSFMANGKQHYVPRFLLRAFRSSTSTKHPHVWYFDKLTEKISHPPVEKVCAEFSFYNFDGRLGLDTGLKKVEDKASPVHQSILQNNDLAALTPTGRIAIAMLFATQHLRTRGLLNTISDALQQVNGSPPLDSDEDAAKAWQFHLTKVSLPEYVKTIIRMKWLLLVNETPSPFWLSDNPVVYYNNLTHDPRDAQGFDRIGSQMHFPLSPSLILSVLDPRVFAHYGARKPVTEERNVIFYNSLQVKRAERFLVSNENNFTLAMSMIKNNPRLRNPSPGRFEHLA